jgi:hypothetical protein
MGWCRGGLPRARAAVGHWIGTKMLRRIATESLVVSAADLLGEKQTDRQRLGIRFWEHTDGTDFHQEKLRFNPDFRFRRRNNREFHS